MLDRLFVQMLSAFLALAPVHAFASQNQLSSPTTGTVSGLQLTNSYNNALDSVNAANSGASSPTNQLSGSPSIGNWWLDTNVNPSPLGMFSSASHWPAIGALDTINNLWNMQIGGGTASVASAATTDLCSGVPQNFLTVTGSTTITSFGSTCVAGQIKAITFSAVLTLTYNASSLIIPGAASVATSAGDQAIVVALGSGNWQVIAYTPATGQALINAAIDVGAVEWTFSPNIPSSKYLWAYGQAVSRTTYATLLTALTITQSVTRTSGSPTLTGFSDTTQIATSAAVEGSGIPTGATIVSCTSTTCTMSANASSSGTANVTIFNYGDGNGSTTFNIPNCAGNVMAGRDNMSGTPRGLLTSTYMGVNPDALGAQGGAQNQTLAQANLPSVNLPVTSIVVNDPGHTHNEQTAASSGTTGSVARSNTGNGAAGSGQDVTISATGITLSGSVPLGGSATPLAIIQPTITANCMIRALTKLELPLRAPADRLAANDDQAALIERRRAA